MRQSRFTYLYAFHHVMNRGYNGLIIFPSKADKKYFISIMKKRSRLLKIKILAYCIMNNHYHIILQNTSGMLSDFMKQLNSIYATYYRKKYGGRGYVFQDRFKSTLIQDEQYLLTAIYYTLLNPVRAKLVNSIFDYKASSVNEYFSKQNNNITDNKFVEKLIVTKNNLINLGHKNVKIEEKKSRMGNVLGENEFIKKIQEKYNRRKNQEKTCIRRRISDISFETKDNIIKKFEKEEKIKVSNINIHKIEGKRKRLKLLINLREKCGLKYKEINQINIFQNLKLYSLSVLYNRGKSKCTQF